MAVCSLLYRILSIVINQIDNSDYCTYLDDCAADHIHDGILHSMLFSPSMNFVVILVIYLLICIIYTPLYLLAFLVTTWGSIAIFLGLLIYCLRKLGTAIAFPGSTSSLQREISLDYLRRVTTQLETIGNACCVFSVTMINAAGGKLHPREFGTLRQQLSDMVMITNVVHKFSKWISASLPELVGQAEEEEMKHLRRLSQAVNEMATTLHEFRHIMARSKGGTAALAQQAGLGQRIILPPAGGPTLMRVLQAGKELMQAVGQLKCRMPSADQGIAQDGVLSAVINTLKSFIFKDNFEKGTSKLSFILMREQLKDVYGAERYSVTGRDGNLIDAIIVSASRASRTSNQGIGGDGSDSASHHYPPSAVGTVLFYSPNAGMFECFAMSSKETSWLGFYTSLGFDVCMYNYRGYSSSTGVPSPDACKSDGMVMLDFLQDRGVKRLILHGESIGGMMACHVAARFTNGHTSAGSAVASPGKAGNGNVSKGKKNDSIGANTGSNSGSSMSLELLVCDRTFASLDSVAERLLGAWASFGLRWVMGWRTDVVQDYLDTKCARVILQDPNDQIVYHSSSLKSGVAARAIYSDSLYQLRHLAREYQAAILEGGAELLPAPVLTPPRISTHSSLGETRLSSVNDRGEPITGNDAAEIAVDGVPSAERHAPVEGVGVGVDESVLFNDSGYTSAGAPQLAHPYLPRGLPSGQLPVVSEATVAHFSACMVDIGRRARMAADFRRHYGYNSRSHQSSSPRLARTGSSGSGGTLNGLERRDHSSSSGGVQGKVRVLSDEEEGLWMEDGGTRSNSFSLEMDMSGTSDGANGRNRQKLGVPSLPPSGRHSCEYNFPWGDDFMYHGHVYEEACPGTGSHCMLCTEWLEQCCSMQVIEQDTMHALFSHGPRDERIAPKQIYTASLTPLEKVFISLVRVDGGTGQLMGQALDNAAGGGLDELRTWLANLLFWHIGGRCATYDTLLPSSRVPLHVALQEIMYLRENFPELNSDASVCYVADLLSSMPLPPGEDYYADSMQVSNSELNRSVGAVGSPSPNGPVGMVLPLHCGHNGWPPMSDLSLLVEAIRAAAFDVCPTV
jgi:hypothetical protein